MKIVLALAPVWDSYTPNLALAFLKGSLQQVGYDCKCIDFSADFRPIMVSVMGDANAEEYIASHPDLYKRWAKQICDERPDIVGFSLLGSNLNNALLVANEVRKTLPNVMIVSGGPSLTRENMGCIQQAFLFSDYVIEGEGEQALVEFVKCVENKGSFLQLKQIWYKDAAGDLHYTGNTSLQNIDTIPYPDFTDFDRSKYPKPNMLPLLFSRGCILNCNYCENKWNHLTQRSRTGKNVFDELKFQVLKYGIDEYMFNDDSLISSKTMRQLNDYCDLALAEGLVLPWSVYGTRVERLITEEFLQKLRKSGMQQVSLGVETFSSKVQKEMGKSSRYDDADRMCKMFATQGIKTQSWIIYGYPTETETDFKENLDWFIQNPNVLSQVTANVFGPNAKYMHDRPGVVVNKPGPVGSWEAPGSTLQKRKERFFALIEVLESIRIARKGEFSYIIGDPLYTKYLRSWTPKDKKQLLQSWEKIENTASNKRSNTGPLHRLLTTIGFSRKPRKLQTLLQTSFNEKKKLNVGEVNLMREQLRLKLMEHIVKNSTGSEQERNEKLKNYLYTLEQAVLHLNENISEEILLAMAVSSNTEDIVYSLETHAPEYIAQQTVEATANFILPEKAVK